MSLKSVAAYSSHLDKLSSIFMDIGRSAPRHESIALLYPYSKRLQSNLAEYFVMVVGFCQQIWKFVSALSDSELKAYQSDLKTWANAIREEVNILMAQKINEEGHKTSKITTLITKRFGFMSQQQNLRKKLQVLDLCSTYDYQTTWKQTRKIGNSSLFSQCIDYQNWRSQVGSSTLIYLGKLGSGKSVLLVNIVDDLISWVPEKTSPVAYFFCRHDSPESLKARTIMGSLVRQLLLLVQDLPLAELPNESISYLDAESLCSLLYRIFPTNRPAYVVLDGLDECDLPTADLILRQLGKLQKSIILHLCIAIRLDPATSQSLGLKELASTKKVQMPDDNRDIEAYIDAELERRVESGKLKMGNPAIILEIQQKLMKGSQGMFLWVTLQLESLCIMHTDEAISQALDDLPKDLPETFSRILQRSEELGKTFQKRILEFVTAAFRPLTIEELREALSVVPSNTVWNPSSLVNDMISILACCGGLVVVDEEERTIRLVHHSFKQFLLNGFYDTANGIFTMDLMHKSICETIVTYLNYGIFETQLSTTIVPRMKMGSAPSRIIQSTIDSSRGQNIALKLLKSRKMPNFDMGKAVADASSHYNSCSVDRFHVHDYAKSFCMQHILYASKQEPSVTKLLYRLLSKNVINANVAIENGWTPQAWAARRGHEAVVKLLLGTGKVDIDSKDTQRRLWPTKPSQCQASVCTKLPFD
jgi:ankyrin repeat domain-containing protein 50